MSNQGTTNSTSTHTNGASPAVGFTFGYHRFTALGLFATVMPCGLTVLGDFLFQLSQNNIFNDVQIPGLQKESQWLILPKVYKKYMFVDLHWSLPLINPIHLKSTSILINMSTIFYPNPSMIKFNTKDLKSNQAPGKDFFIGWTIQEISQSVGPAICRFFSTNK